MFYWFESLLGDFDISLRIMGDIISWVADSGHPCETFVLTRKGVT